MCDSPFFPSESDALLYSNEVEFTLPVPEEILSTLHKPKGDQDHDLKDGDVPARELLLVAERAVAESSVTEQSGIEKLSLKSVASNLQTIPEDQQLDLTVAEAEADNMENVPDTNGDMENVPNTENDDADADPHEQQSGLENQTDVTVVDECIAVAENEAHLQDTPHDSSLPQDDASSEVVFELDATVFRDRGESVSAKDANLGPLEEETEAEEIETQLLGIDTDEGDLGEHSDVDKEILDNERNDDDNSDQQENQGNGLSKEVPDEKGFTYQATSENDTTEGESKLDNEAETFGTERIPQQSDSDFWDHGEKQHEEGIAKEAIVFPTEHSDDNGHSPSRAGQNDVECHESKHAADFQEHLELKTQDTDTRKDHDEPEVSHSEGLEQATYTGNRDESQARDDDVGLDTNDDGLISELISKRNGEENNSPDKDNSNLDEQEASYPVNNAGADDDTSAVNVVSSETWQKESEENTKLSGEATDSKESKESRKYKEECDNRGVDPELKVEIVNQLDGEVEIGLEGDEALEKILTGAVELLQAPSKNISMVVNQDISLPEEEKEDEDEEDDDRNGKRFRENSTIDETMPCENVNSGESKPMAKQELKSEHFTSDQIHSTDNVTNETKPTAKGDKQTCNEMSKDTWSASSNLGSEKKEDDDNKDEMETTDMPTFEEAAFEDGVLSSHSNMEVNGGLQQVDKEHEYSKRNEERPCGGDSLQGKIW